MSERLPRVMTSTQQSNAAQGKSGSAFSTKPASRCPLPGRLTSPMISAGFLGEAP
jgi:hypothetical protein